MTVLDAGSFKLHFVKRVLVNEVQATAPSISTLVSLKPSIMGSRTSAEGAWVGRDLGSSFWLKVRVCLPMAVRPSPGRSGQALKEPFSFDCLKRTSCRLSEYCCHDVVLLVVSQVV